MSAPYTETCRLIADVCIVSRGAVVMVRYVDVSKYDGQAGWFLPDDYVRHGEHPDRAARRIVKEQLGISERPTLAFMESFDGNVWHIVFHYSLPLPARARLRPSATLADARWIATRALPRRADVAHHGWALDVLRRIRRTAFKRGRA